MRSLLLLAATLLASRPASAQVAADPASTVRPGSTSQLRQLDRDVWHPFVRGVNADSAALYVGVHAPDFHWVAPGSAGRIMDRAEYDEDSRQVMARRRAEGSTGELAVRFLERNVTERFAAEQVVMRFAMRRAGAAPEVSYGIAHVFSRRDDDGRWRVVLRYGSRERATAATWEKAVAPTPEG